MLPETAAHPRPTLSGVEPEFVGIGPISREGFFLNRLDDIEGASRELLDAAEKLRKHPEWQKLLLEIRRLRQLAGEVHAVAAKIERTVFPPAGGNP